jgi:hypothetical protein
MACEANAIAFWSLAISSSYPARKLTGQRGATTRFSSDHLGKAIDLDARHSVFNILNCFALTGRVTWWTADTTVELSPRNLSDAPEGDAPIRLANRVLVSGQGRVSRTQRLSTTVRNCTRDEGGPFEAGSQVQVSSHRELLSSRAMVVSVAETPGHDPGRQG